MVTEDDIARERWWVRYVNGEARIERAYFAPEGGSGLPHGPFDTRAEAVAYRNGLRDHPKGERLGTPRRARASIRRFTRREGDRR